MKKYERIDCNIYDSYEAFATFKTVLSIVYLDEGGMKQEVRDYIKTLETKNKEEFLITNDGVKLRLDQIVSTTKI